MKTPQEIFDQVSKHLLTQNRQAVSGGLCKYRAPNGDRCAVGCLIPAELYDEKIENTSVAVLLKSRVSSTDQENKTKLATLRDVLIKSGIDLDDTQVSMLVIELQQVHDHHDIPRWPNRLETLANEFQLTYNA